MRIQKNDNTAFKQRYFLPYIERPFQGVSVYKKLQKFLLAADEPDSMHFFASDSKRSFVLTGKDIQEFINFRYESFIRNGQSETEMTDIFFKEAVELDEKKFAQLDVPLIDTQKDYKINFLNTKKWGKAYTVLDDYLKALGIKSAEKKYFNTKSRCVYFPIKNANSYNFAYNHLSESDVSIREMKNAQPKLMSPDTQKFGIKDARKITASLRKILELD